MTFKKRISVLLICMVIMIPMFGCAEKPISGESLPAVSKPSESNAQSPEYTTEYQNGMLRLQGTYEDYCEIEDGYVFLSSVYDGERDFITCFDNDFNEIWTIETAKKDYDDYPEIRVGSNCVYYYSRNYNDRQHNTFYITAYSLDNGDELWKKSFDSSVYNTDLGAAGGNLLIYFKESVQLESEVTGDNALYAIDENGNFTKLDFHEELLQCFPNGYSKISGMEFYPEKDSYGFYAIVSVWQDGSNYSCIGNFDNSYRLLNSAVVKGAPTEYHISNKNAFIQTDDMIYLACDHNYKDPETGIAKSDFITYGIRKSMIVLFAIYTRPGLLNVLSDTAFAVTERDIYGVEKNLRIYSKNGRLLKTIDAKGQLIHGIAYRKGGYMAVLGSSKTYAHINSSFEIIEKMKDNCDFCFVNKNYKLIAVN